MNTMKMNTTTANRVARSVPAASKCVPTVHTPQLAREASVKAVTAPLRRRSTVAKAAAVAPVPTAPVAKYDPNNLAHRLAMMRTHFSSAIGIDDFMARVEVALCAYGFTSDNSIAMTNLCRDEVTVVLKDKIESVFGASFNTNGLGAVLTCGVTGIGAGLSHSPQCVDGRERYVFFSFPHIGIDAMGTVGAIPRPGRPGDSCACGALAKCLGELKADGIAQSCKVPGVHGPMDPEYTILKQRLARRMRHEGADIAAMSLVDITSVAERTISDDLEYLIERAVNTATSDYAVVTGIEVHNWGGDGVTNLEFIVPSRLSVCVKGVTTHLDLTAIPPLPPRQIQMFAANSMNASYATIGVISGDGSSQYSHESTLVEIPEEYLGARLGPSFNATPKSAIDVSGAIPAWMTSLQSAPPKPRDAAAPSMESPEIGTMPVRTSFTEKGVVVYFGEAPSEA
jgi:hypothetical protein